MTTDAWSNWRFPDPVPFYMYTDMELLGPYLFKKLQRCGRERPVDYLGQNSSIGVALEFSASKFFVNMMLTHPWRTRKISAAKLFVLTLDLMPFTPTNAGPCSWADYDSLLLIALQSLSRSPPFQISAGLDHLWVITSSCPEILLRMHAENTFAYIQRTKILQHMIVGVMEMFPLRKALAVPLSRDFTTYKFKYRAPLQGFDKYLYRLPWRRPWRCSMPVPFVQSFAFWPVGKQEFAFEHWLQRKYMFFHNTGTMHQGDASKALRQQALHVRGFSSDPSKVWIGEEFLDSASLRHGFESSRFCFCIAGRLGGPTRKFYDAVANMCIPVVVADQWLFAYAPFSTYVDHEEYAIFIPETNWMNDLPLLVKTLEEIPASVLHQKFQALQNVAPFLLYDTLRSHALGSVFIWEAIARCTIDTARNDSVMLPIGKPLVRTRPVLALSGIQVAQDLAM